MARRHTPPGLAPTEARRERELQWLRELNAQLRVTVWLLPATGMTDAVTQRRAARRLTRPHISWSRA